MGQPRVTSTIPWFLFSFLLPYSQLIPNHPKSTFTRTILQKITIQVSIQIYLVSIQVDGDYGFPVSTLATISIETATTITSNYFLEWCQQCLSVDQIFVLRSADQFFIFCRQRRRPRGWPHLNRNASCGHPLSYDKGSCFRDQLAFHFMLQHSSLLILIVVACRHCSVQCLLV